MLNIDENGLVFVVPEAKAYQEIIMIPEDKLQETIKYVYHTYKLPHPLDVYSPMDRKKKVCATYFENKAPEYFESQLYLAPLVKRYLNESMTKTEMFLTNIRKDMDELIEHMYKIPLFKEGKVNTTVLVEIGPGDEREFDVKAKVQIDNSKEKFEVLKRLDDMLALMEKLDAKATEQRRKKKSEKKRIFDV